MHILIDMIGVVVNAGPGAQLMPNIEISYSTTYSIVHKILTPLFLGKMVCTHTI